MAEAKAKLNFLRMSAHKVRITADMVRGKPVAAALASLQHSNKGASRPLHKLLKSALANATENHSLDADKLMVKTIMVDEGPTLKRWMPRAMGRATPIRKRTSKVTIVLAEKE